MEFKTKIENMLNYLKEHPSPHVRVAMGFALILGGLLGPFLPILGIWMIPMGLVLLSVDFPIAGRISAALGRAWRRMTSGREQKPDV